MSARPEGLAHRVLERLFKYRDIVKVVGGEPSLYLRRYFIFRTERFPNNRIFLHFIARDDDDRDLHDHPWDFSSFILKGGYKEYLPGGEKRLLFDFDFVRNPAEHTHRVELHDGEPAWTLVHAGKARRIWGFHTKDGWVDWRSYLGLTPTHPDSPEDA